MFVSYKCDLIIYRIKYPLPKIKEKIPVNEKNKWTLKKNRNFKDIHVKVLIILLYGKYQYIGLKF